MLTPAEREFSQMLSSRITESELHGFSMSIADELEWNVENADIEDDDPDTHRQNHINRQSLFAR